jgi:hypothetical protein
MKFNLDPIGCIGVCAVERVIREKGPEIAQCRTGRALAKYKADLPGMDRFPDLAWWASQPRPSRTAGCPATAPSAGSLPARIYRIAWVLED